MSSPDIFFGEGDRSPVIADTLELPDGSEPDLSGKTVEIRYRLKNQTADEMIEAVAFVGDPENADVEWTPAAPAVPGDYNANWIVNRGLADQATYPDDRYLWMRVWPRP